MIKQMLRSGGVVGIIMFSLLPLLPLFIHGISSRWWFPAVLPESIDFRAWQYLFRPDSELLSALYTSLIIGIYTTVLSLALGIPIARMLVYKKNRFLYVAFFFPLLMPALATIYGLRGVFVHFSLSGTLTAVVISHLLITIPYAIYILTGVFSRIDPDYFLQARLLKAGSFTVFWRVGVPLLLPGLTVAGTLIFLVSWHQYLMTFFIGSGRIITLPVLLFSFIVAGDMNLAGATAIIFFLPAIGVLWLNARILKTQLWFP